jgi:hypothetical protein
MSGFLTSESGAVTVDWTVLAASVVGLGVGTTAVVRSGTSALGADINAALSSASVATVGILGTRNSFDFEDGDSGGWNMARFGSSPALGNFLGPFGGGDEPLVHTVRLPDGATSATVMFDLLLLDSWDGTSVHSDFPQGGRGDGIGFEIDGVEIGHSWMHNAAAGTPSGSFEINGTTYSYTMTRVSGGDLYRVGTPVEWEDSRWSVVLTATNPPNGGFALGINSTANQATSDESFGIDNYRFTATTP